MDIRNCRGCGRIFNYAVGPLLCPACRERQEEDFQRVKEYIREHNGVGIREVSQECDVETSQIQQWLREERLELTEGSAISLNCDSCGAPIRTGKYCEKCKYEMTTGFKNAFSQPKPAQEKNSSLKKDGSDKMRFL